MDRKMLNHEIRGKHERGRRIGSVRTPRPTLDPSGTPEAMASVIRRSS